MYPDRSCDAYATERTVLESDLLFHSEKGSQLSPLWLYSDVAQFSFVAPSPSDPGLILNVGPLFPTYEVIMTGLLNFTWQLAPKAVSKMGKGANAGRISANVSVKSPRLLRTRRFILNP